MKELFFGTLTYIFISIRKLRLEHIPFYDVTLKRQDIQALIPCFTQLRYL